MKNKKNDEILRSFFKNHETDIEDNGFSERVMQQIDVKKRCYSKLWEALGYGLCLLLFFLLNGGSALINLFSKGYNYFQLTFKDTSLLNNITTELNTTLIVHIVIVGSIVIGLLVEHLRYAATTH